MKTIFYAAESRGKADYGWLKTRYSFSFANYFNRERMNFGVLRVINDDVISPDTGFGEHPHDNMEIITIVLKGELAHRDSMGNTEIIHEGEIQVMSAGSGITHSEFNPSTVSEVELLQIWVYPDTRNVIPRYDQMLISDKLKKDAITQFISPENKGKSLWIHQNAWFSMGELENEKEYNYRLNSVKNGVFIFVIEGEIIIDNQLLQRRDAMGISELEELKINSNTVSRVLIMEIPMKL